MVCQNQSIDDSDAPLARDIRILIRQRIAEGESNDTVRGYLVSRYGDFVLLDPPFKLETLLLWLCAPLTLAAGLGAVVIARRRAPGRDAGLDRAGGSGAGRPDPGGRLKDAAFVGPNKVEKSQACWFYRGVAMTFVGEFSHGARIATQMMGRASEAGLLAGPRSQRRRPGRLLLRRRRRARSAEFVAPANGTYRFSFSPCRCGASAARSRFARAEYAVAAGPTLRLEPVGDGAAIDARSTFNSVALFQQAVQPCEQPSEDARVPRCWKTISPSSPRSVVTAVWSKPPAQLGR